MIMMIKYDMLIAHAISKTKDKYAMYNKIREMVVLLTAYRLDGLRTWAAWIEGSAHRLLIY